MGKKKGEKLLNIGMSLLRRGVHQAKQPSSMLWFCLKVPFSLFFLNDIIQGRNSYVNMINCNVKKIIDGL